MIYTIRQIKSGKGIQPNQRFLSLDDATVACDPDALEDIAEQIEAEAYFLSAGIPDLGGKLRAIAKKQRALLEGHA